MLVVISTPNRLVKALFLFPLSTYLCGALITEVTHSKYSLFWKTSAGSGDEQGMEELKERLLGLKYAYVCMPHRVCALIFKC